MEVVEKPITVNQISFEQREKNLQQIEKEEEKERKGPFHRFYQINKEKSEFLRHCLRDNPKALELLLFLFDHMDKYNAVVCSYKVFEEVLKMSRATASRAIKYLKDHGFIYVYKSGTSNVYVANNALVWNSWGNNMQYCEFPANVVLSSSEQEEQAKVREEFKKTVRLTHE